LAEEIAMWHAARVHLVQAQGMMPSRMPVNDPVVQPRGYQVDYLVDDLWQDVYVPEPPKKVFDTPLLVQPDVALVTRDAGNEKATGALPSPEKSRHEAAAPVARQRSPKISSPPPDITDESFGFPERPPYQASEISFLLSRVGQTLGSDESKFSVEDDQHREEDEHRQADLAARLKALARPSFLVETPTNEEAVPEPLPDSSKFATSNTTEQTSHSNFDASKGPQGARCTSPNIFASTNSTHIVIKEKSEAEPVFDFSKFGTASMSTSSGFDVSEQRLQRPIGDTGLEGAIFTPTDLTARTNCTTALEKDQQASMNRGWMQGDLTAVPDLRGGHADSLNTLVLDTLGIKPPPPEHRPLAQATNSRPPLDPSASTPNSRHPMSPAKQQQQQQQQQTSNFYCQSTPVWHQPPTPTPTFGGKWHDGCGTRCASETPAASLTPRACREPVAMTSQVQHRFDPSFRSSVVAARHSSASPGVARGRQHAAHKSPSPRSSMPSTARPHARPAAAGVAIVYGSSK